jgi:GxxExxY protein
VLRDGGITQETVEAAIEVHKPLGPGLLESAYEECLCYELKQRRLAFRRQVDLPVVYKGTKLECGYRLDVVVERRVLLEPKCVERVLPIHEAQLLTYLRLSGIGVGLLINFNVPALQHGIMRRVL